jgi:SAM-dependent methyltransferase
MTTADDHWAAGDAYEAYMGRWSRPLARTFVGWLSSPPAVNWLEVGCGTGALTRAICELTEPASVLACDPSDSFVSHAQGTIRDGRVSFVVAGAEGLPGAPRAFDYVVSGLVLNFVADPLGAVKRMAERLSPGGVVAAYVWDYGDGMEFLRCFWDEAVALDPAAASLDEARRFPLCRPAALHSLFVQAGLNDVATDGLQVPTHFRGIEDLWTPFLRGTGPAPSYATSLSPEGQSLLRARLAERLRPTVDGDIRLQARAWAVRGVYGRD